MTPSLKINIPFYLCLCVRRRKYAASFVCQMYRPDCSRPFGIKTSWFLNIQFDPLVNIPVSETHIKANQVQFFNPWSALSLSLFRHCKLCFWLTFFPYSSLVFCVGATTLGRWSWPRPILPGLLYVSRLYGWPRWHSTTRHKYMPSLSLKCTVYDLDSISLISDEPFFRWCGRL
jgi:hypothetical protein